MDITPETRLPLLRDELQFLSGGSDGEGRAGFLIFDPVRYQYFRIGISAAKIFAAWGAGTVGALIKRLKDKGAIASLEEIGMLIGFVTDNLLVVAGAGSGAFFEQQNLRAKKSLLMRLVHNYLFFKIPLFRPQKFLNASFAYVAWFGSRAAIWSIVAISLIGLYLTARQGDVFVHSFADFANWRGALLLFISLAVLKSGHELGHAFMATRYGLRVPVIGIAFMVMFPMLYSDVSDVWRLKRKRQRLMVDGAGMMVELALGGICLFLWALMAPGLFRDLCFFIATTGWIMSLAVNLSPFMRFDGYHILADSLGIHNLQARGFALGKWQMRKILFGENRQAPEQFLPRMHRTLVAYAWGTWIYRFFLFAGIALLVYFMFFKLLGIVLFGVEIMWFIGLPIFKEVQVWWQRRGEYKSNKRAIFSFSVFCLVVVALFLPLSRSVNIAGVRGVKQEAGYFSPVGARVEKVFVKPGERVKNGDVLVSLISVENKEAEERATLKLSLVEKRLARGVASKSERALRSVLLREKTALVAEIEGLEAMAADLVLRARFNGVVTDVARGIRSGLWVNSEVRLVHVAARAGQVNVRGLVTGQDVDRLSAGAKGVFVFDDARLKPLDLVLTEIGLGGDAGRVLVYLSSANGGPIKMDVGKNGAFKPAEALYPVKFRVLNPEVTGWLHEARGTVVVAAKPISIMGRFFRQAAAVLLRESGF